MNAPSAGYSPDYSPASGQNSPRRTAKLQFELPSSGIEVDITRQDATVFSFFILNDTDHITNHKIWVTCTDNPFWEGNWYSFDAKDSEPLSTPTTPNYGQSPEPSRLGLAWKETTVGQLLEATLTHGHRREIEIRLAPGVSSQARAGRYSLEVHIESRGHLDNNQLAPEDDWGQGPVTFESHSLHPVITILPFYRWKASLEPRRVKVGLFRRRADVSLHIVNAGNDWLYLDLAVPEITEAQWKVPGERLAIPPANQGEREWNRLFPLEVRTFKKQVRGVAVPQNLDVTLRSLDAPSVRVGSLMPQAGGRNGRPNPMNAPWPAPWAGQGQGLPPEMADSANHFSSPPADPASLQKASGAELVYAPPIPATATGIFKVLRDNAVAIVMGIIGLSVALSILAFTIQTFKQRAMEVTVTSLEKPDFNKGWTIETRYLMGSEITFVQSNSPSEKVDARFTAQLLKNGLNDENTSHKKAIKDKTRILLFEPIKKTPQNRAYYDDKKGCFLVPVQAGVEYTVQVRRPIPILGKLLTPGEAPFFIPLPKLKPKTPQKAAPLPFVSADTRGTQEQGNAFSISGKNLGIDGKVFLGGQPIQVVEWTPNEVTFTIPVNSSLIGPGISIALETKSGVRLNAGTVTITEPKLGSDGQELDVPETEVPKRFDPNTEKRQTEPQNETEPPKRFDPNTEKRPAKPLGTDPPKRFDPNTEKRPAKPLGTDPPKRFDPNTEKRPAKPLGTDPPPTAPPPPPQGEIVDPDKGDF